MTEQRVDLFQNITSKEEQTKLKSTFKGYLLGLPLVVVIDDDDDDDFSNTTVIELDKRNLGVIDNVSNNTAASNSNYKGNDQLHNEEPASALFSTPGSEMINILREIRR